MRQTGQSTGFARNEKKVHELAKATGNLMQPHLSQNFKEAKTLLIQPLKII